MNALELAERLHHELPTILRIDAENAGEMLRAQHEAIKQLREALNTVEWHGGGSCWVVDAEAIEAALAATEALT